MGVSQGVFLGVSQGVFLGVSQGVFLDVFLGVSLGVFLGVFLGVSQGVSQGVFQRNLDTRQKLCQGAETDLTFHASCMSTVAVKADTETVCSSFPEKCEFNCAK